MEIKWNDNLCIDNGEIDHDHQIFISKTNKFLGQGRRFSDIDKARKYLNDLRIHLITHIDHEEKYQEMIGYSDLENHRQLHRQLIMHLDQFLKEINTAKNHDMADVSKKTAHFLVEFLVNHLLNEDMKMKNANQQMAHLKRAASNIEYI